MVIQLSDGKYLHTAYAISNIAEELGADDWSLTDQEGMLYIGTYIDGNSVDSTDPTAYNWEELVDEDVDDEDSEGVMPVADFQSQIDALADQIGIQQSTTEELQESIDNANQNLSSSTELANNAQQIAGNTNQYFWHTESGTDTGAHITEIPQEQFLEDPSNGGGNLLARSNGIAVRDGLEELSTFGADGIVIGKENETHSVIDKQSMRVIGANSDNDVTPVSYIGLLNGRATGYASLIEHPTVKVSSGADLSSVQVDLSHTVKSVVFCQTLILNEQVDLLSRTSFTDGDSFITLNLSGIGVTAGVSYMIFINYLTADLIPCYSFSNKDVAVLGSLNSGAYSMMIGQDVSASGYGAFAQGLNSYASVPYAFASGVDNDVNGEGATARGRCLKINNKGGTDQTVIGHYNSPVEDKAFVIGNGTADDSRSNAFDVDWDGNVLASGDVTDGDGNVLSDKISRSDLFFKSGDVYSVTYNRARALTGYVSSSTKGMYFEIPLPKFLTDVSSATITAMTGGVRGISGYVNGLTNGSNLKSGYTVTASVDNPNTLYVSVVSSSTLSNVTNNTPISVALNSISITFS